MKTSSMKTSTIVTYSLVATSVLVATMASAMADTNDASTTRRIEAPSNALEIAVASMYSQGTGKLGGGMQDVEDVAGPGGGIELSVGWRATPNLLIGVYANAAGSGDDTDNEKAAVTAAAGFKADWHFLPTASVDPWISVGAGGKLMAIEDGAKDKGLTGVEGRIQIGADYRVSPRFAFGPVIGVSAATYTHTYDDVDSDESMEISDKKVHWNFTAGLQGRFDLFGSTR